MASLKSLELPTDIITDILLQLPVKPLLRFQLVSKSFQNIITSQKFIKDHLQTSMESKAHINVILSDVCSSYYIKVDPVGNLSGEANSLNVILSDVCSSSDKKVGPVENLSGKANSLNIPLCKDKEDVWLGNSIKGPSCNGLVLLVTNKDKRIVLWNPSTRRYKLLPIPPIGGPAFNRNQLLQHGLGYDSVTDDYKVVIIIEKIPIRSVDFWVYSLRTNSLEKKDFPYNRYSFCRSNYRAVFANGAFHWTCLDNNNLEIILAFDLTNETFSRFPKPSFDHGGSSDDHFQDLIEFEGSLCMRTAFKCNDVWYWELYVGEKHKNHITWCKLFKFSPPERWGYDSWHLEPLMCSKDGNKVLSLYDVSNLFWCDHKSGEMFDFFAENKLVRTIICCESLVSPGNDSAFDGEDYSSELNMEEDG